MNDMRKPPQQLMPWKSTVDESRLPPIPDIPRQRYLDEEFFQAEMKHVFRKVWLVAGHESEYPKPGSYRLLDVELAPVVVVRGKDNKLRAFLNSCQHRGATVLKAREGCTPVMSCQYHGWTYNLEGQLVGVTEPHTFPHLNPDDYRLQELRCESWGGLIFINFDKNAKPLKEYLTPTVLRRYGPIFESPLRIISRQEWDFNCNWKLPADAFREAYHIDTIHKKTVAQMIDCKQASIDMNHNGHDTITVPYWPKQAMENAEWDAIPLLSGIAPLPLADSKEFTESVIELNLFPNVSMAFQAVGFPLFSFWPISVGRTRVEAMWLGVDWGDGPKSAAWDTVTLGSQVVASEDLGNLMSMQASLMADPDRGIPLSTKETPIYQMHAEIDRLIGAENIPEHLRVPDLLKDFYV